MTSGQDTSQEHASAARITTLDAALARIDELERICAEVYQVVGILSDEAGRFDDDASIKAMDNLSQQRLVHEDVLPFPCSPDRFESAAVAWMSSGDWTEDQEEAAFWMDDEYRVVQPLYDRPIDVWEMRICEATKLVLRLVSEEGGCSARSLWARWWGQWLDLRALRSGQQGRVPAAGDKRKG
jgi:hypothetical protein